MLTAGKFSEKSDVWSFGVTLYEIVTYGSTPYPGLSTAQVYQKVVEEKYRMEKPKDIPDSVWDVIQSCWTQKPKHRPTFAELVAKLSEIKEEMENDESDELEVEVERGTSRFKRSLSRKGTMKTSFYGSNRPYSEGLVGLDRKESKYELSKSKPNEYEASKSHYMTSPPSKTNLKENEYQTSPASPKDKKKKKESAYDLTPESGGNVYEVSVSAKAKESEYELSPLDKPKKEKKSKKKEEDVYGMSPSEKAENVYETSPKVELVDKDTSTTVKKEKKEKKQKKKKEVELEGHYDLSPGNRESTATLITAASTTSADGLLAP